MDHKERNKKHRATSSPWDTTGKMVLVSDNCSVYTDAASILVRTTATARPLVQGGKACTTELPIAYSCQTRALEAPDTATRSMLLKEAQQQLAHCDVGSLQLRHRTTHLGARVADYSAHELNEFGLASNCFRNGNDINDAKHVTRATCTNQYEYRNAAGETARDTNHKLFASLATCDMGDTAMPQLEEDLKKMIVHNTDLNGFRVTDPNHLACSISMLPSL